ncbi:MAG: hypothetical protein DI538_26810, partial [Azospira oryzae]
MPESNPPQPSRPQIPAQPLQKIGMALSGGGYRAASFHLGSMSYLHRIQFQGKPLLDKVVMLSTVSGGTITGAVYALRKQKGESFEKIYDFLVGKLKTLDFVKGGIEKLTPEAIWTNTHKRRNFINAFAEQYDEELTEGATFAAFANMKPPLEAVVFNSTEFNNGNNFRFRSNGNQRFGNYKYKIPWEQATEIKVADALAASSCFTGGFEPILWPRDFVHGKSPQLEAESKKGAALGLMDGGIFDNQGLDSLLTYKNSYNRAPYFELVIASDVTSPYM